MNFIVIGFKSCGKSSAGRELAHRCGMVFCDTDTLLEQRYTDMTGDVLSFREIYRNHGRAYFLELERQVVESLHMVDNTVIAAGGATFINHPIDSELRRRSVIVYLDVLPDVLIQRIERGGRPAFLDTDDWKDAFLQTYQEREPRYRTLADYCINAGTCSAEEVAEAIIRAYETSTTV